jgi:subtilisin-like proprotein convertase family protein
MKRLFMLVFAALTLVLLSGCGEAISAAIKNSVFDSNTTYAISDGTTADSTNEVSTSIISLTSISVWINLDHNRSGDMKLVLVNPLGTEVVLSDHNGGDDNTSGLMIFTEDSTQSITTASAPFNDVYQPQESLESFHDQSPNGTWHLKISDTINNTKEGILNEWLIIIGGIKG